MPFYLPARPPWLNLDTRVQHHVAGPGSSRFLEKITPSSVTNLPTGHSTLSCFLHPGTGGIVDDTVITRLSDGSYYLVTNAACRKKVLGYIDQQIREVESGDDQVFISWNVCSDRGLIALQGPLSASILQNALGSMSGVDLNTLYFGQSISVTMSLPGGDKLASIIISRGGYTGEDGFELSIPSANAVEITDHLLSTAGTEQLRLAGLGARDSLRLEAGMCLYGHDLDDSTTPVEAGLSWIVHQDRRATGGFHGSDVILRQLRPLKEGGGPSRRRVGLIVEGAPAREGAMIISPTQDNPSGEDKTIGKVTSGCPSPTLGQNIAMGYVESGYHKIGTDVGVVVRGKRRRAKVVKMPFVKSKYWKEPGSTAPA